MEGGKRVQLIIAVVVVIALGFAYGVGYYVGNEAGVEREKRVCEAQKKQLIKTFSRIAPVSRPELPDETADQRPEDQVENSQAKEEEIAQAETSNRTAEEEAYATNATRREEEKPEVEPEKQENETWEAEETKGYYVQLGMFRNKENAFRLARKLQDAGFKPKTEFSKSFVKVFIGYFADKNEALRVKRKLKNLGFESILRRKN